MLEEVQKIVTEEFWTKVRHPAAWHNEVADVRRKCHTIYQMLKIVVMLRP